MADYTPEEIQQAMRAAKQAGNVEAFHDLGQRLRETYEAEAKNSATEGTGTGQRVLEGIGQGMSNVARHVGNVVGAKGDLPFGMGNMSDEGLAEAKQRDAALLDTRAGKVGSFLGEIAATAPVGGLGLGAARAGAAKLGAGAATRFLAGAAGAGATQGAAEGALMADKGERLMGAGVGAVGGAAIPYVGGKAWRALVRGVNPTKAARYLLNRGVDLTPGQMNPGSSLGTLEEGLSNVWGIGPMIKSARDASREQWQAASREVGLSPTMLNGAAPTAAGKGAAKGGVDQMYGGFRTAYDEAKGFPTYPRQVRTAGGDVHLADTPAAPGSFTRAAQSPSVRATPDTRASTHSWLQDQLGALKPNKKTGLVDSEDLLELRSNIRTEIRDASLGASPDKASADLLRKAEQEVTDVLESQLPPDALAKLRATDAQYSQYKILEDATRRAGDQVGGMSPAHLSAAVRAATPAGPYARGLGGPLRQMARSGRQVLDERTAPTGARLISLLGPAALIKSAPILGLPAAGLIGTQFGRKILKGGTAGQRYGRELAAALRRPRGKLGGVRGKGLGSAYGAALGERTADERFGD
jgi:hypothetical protein